MTDRDINALINDMHAKSGSFAVSIASVSKFLMGTDSWFEEAVTYLEDNIHQLIFRDLGVAHVTACDKMKAIVVHQNSPKKATQTQLPPVLPHSMVNLCPAKLICKVHDQHNCLYHLFPLTAHIDVLGDHQKDLLTDYCVEPSTRKLIELCNMNTSFAEAWRLLGRCISDLMKICGGIATILPGTSTVKYDFSILRWEEDMFRKCLFGFALEGVMQENQ